MLERPMVILSDVHLSHQGRKSAGRALAELIAARPGHEIVLNGDIFDLSVDPPRRDPGESLSSLMASHPELSHAVAEHLSAGHHLTLIAGNHDAAVCNDGVRAALLSALRLQGDAPLEISPWFVRRNGVHIEHGHLYDPDNAPNHPLAEWSPEAEPLGIALTRRFLAPSRALDFKHAYETTPLHGLLRTFQLYGARAPYVVARYFATAIRINAEAGRQPALIHDRQLGAALLDDFGRARGVAAEILDELLAAAPTPTHHCSRETFMRLYFDRVIACVLGTGAFGSALFGNPFGVGLAAACGAYLSWSVSRGRSRYSGLPAQRLRDAAARIVELSNAELVSFGHTHVLESGPSYHNSGSFGYAAQAGRPYLVVDRLGKVEVGRAHR